MKRDFYKSPKSNWITRLFWRAAGADRYLLEQSTYSDQVKYACLGGIVVATGFMAALAGGYAMYTIFEPKGTVLDSEIHTPTVIKAVAFGIIWGLIIFNIDRFIVAATGKGDGTEAITSQEFKSALPRIIMGLVIALTISKPVEIRMFKSEIDVEIHKEQLKKQQEHLSQLDSLYSERIKSQEDKIKSWKDEITRREKALSIAEQNFNQELMEKGNGGTGYGPDAREKKAIMNDRKKDVSIIREKNSPLIAQAYKNIQQYEAEKQQEIKNSEKVAAGLDGLLERIKLAHQIAGVWISLFITLLFVVIELTPIFFKMMLIKSPYDYLEDNVKELIKAEKGLQIKYDYYQDKEGQEKDLVIDHEAEKRIHEKAKLIQAQKELSEYVVEKWLNQEKKKADENLDNYIA